MSRSQFHASTTIIIVLMGTGPACSANPDKTSSSSTSSTSSAGDGSTTGPGQASSSSEPTSVGTTTTVVECSNGAIDEVEVCDDGNVIDGDGCNADCMPSGRLLYERREVNGTAVHDLAVDSAGNVVVGGLAKGVGGKQWLARYNPDLTPDWSQSYGPGQFEIITGVAIKGDAIFAAGAVGEADTHDIWVSRIDLKGTIVWERVDGDGGDDYATEVAVTADGDVIVSGLTSIEGNFSLWLRQYTQNGDSVWTSTFPIGTDMAGFPLGPGLSVTAESAVVGFFRFQGDLTPELVTVYALAGGDPKWVLDVPQSSGLILGVANDPGGDILLAGYTFAGSMIVRRLTAKGDVSWSSEKCVGESGREIAVDGHGDIVAIGDGPGVTGSSIRLCKFGPDGNFKWGKDIDGGLGNDIGQTVAIGPANTIVVGGSVGDTDPGKRVAWLAVYSP